ncbi:unnamed protein product [Ixodes pacificus]
MQLMSSYLHRKPFEESRATFPEISQHQKEFANKRVQLENITSVSQKEAPRSCNLHCGTRPQGQTHFHDVLHDRSPAGHLISLFGNAFLAGHVVHLLSAPLQQQ